MGETRKGRRRQWLAVLAASLLLVGAGCSRTGPASTAGGESPVVLRAVSGFAMNSPDSDYLKILAKNVQEMSGGRLQIEIKGGPEVIPSFDLAEAVRNGVVDLGYLTSGYYVSMIPEATVLTYSDYTFEEELANGAWEYLNQIHESKGNLHLVYVVRGMNQFALYTTKPVDSIDDLRGMRLRVPPALIPFAKAVGASILTTPLAEVYTALERNMIDGVGAVDKGITFYGWEEFLRYAITPGLYAGDQVLIANLDKWKSLPQELQQTLFDAAKQSVPEYIELWDRIGADEQEKLEQQGFQTIDLGPQLTAIAKEAAWQHVRETLGDQAQRLEQLFRRPSGSAPGAGSSPTGPRSSGPGGSGSGQENGS